MVILITSPICQTKDYQDYKNVAESALLIHNEVHMLALQKDHQ